MDVLADMWRRRGVRALLLFYLFVLKAAADCPTPKSLDNIVLTDEALLLNVFPNGSTVTLECANGYVKESGSGVSTCIGGVWDKPDLTCKKKDCGLPKPQSNMRFDMSKGTLFDAIITVYCDEGYQVSGNSFKQCFATGWNGKAKCEIVTCDIPANVANGRSSWTSPDYPKYGQIIHYICDDGYIRAGKENITCGQTGEYDSQPPECNGVTTKEPMVKPPSTPPAQDSSATPTAHRDKNQPITTSATPPVSPSAGGRGNLTTTTSVTTTTSSQDDLGVAVDTNKDIGYMPVIVSVICVALAVSVIILFLHKYLLKRKGSYDTREDLKPELLQFQNL